MAAARVMVDGRHLPQTLPRGVEIVMAIEEVEPVPGTDCSFQAHCRATSRRVARWPQQVDALHRALAFALHALSAPDSGSRHAASHSGGVSDLARTRIARGPAVATGRPTCKRQGGNIRRMLDTVGLPSADTTLCPAARRAHGASAPSSTIDTIVSDVVAC